MDSDDLPLSSEQLSIVGMALAVVIVSVAAPMVFAPQSNAPDDANSGTVYSTPTGDDQQAESASTPTNPASNPFDELSTAPRDPDEPLSTVPETHVESNTTEPSLSASAGAQTLRASTTTVDGEPALNLTDDRTHDGRWVGVSTDWLKDQHGSVPAVVGVVHESGKVYQEEIHVRNGEAQFWVSGFSTNTITFGGTLQIDGQPATTGTTHLYEVRDLDSATDPEITLTGQVNTERDTKQVIGATDGQSIPLAVAGDNLAPRNPEVTFTGVTKTTSDAGLFSTTLSDGGTVDYSVDGNQPATDVSATFIGKSTTSTGSLSHTGLSDGATISYTVGGNIPANNAAVTFSGYSSRSSHSITGTTGSSVTRSLPMTGNREPTDGNGNNPSVTVTGHSPTMTETAGDKSGTSQTFDGSSTVTLDWTPQTSGSINDIHFYVQSSEGNVYGKEINIYDSDGNTITSTGEVVVKEGQGVKSLDNSIKYDSYNGDSVQAGETYTIEFVPDSISTASMEIAPWVSADVKPSVNSVSVSTNDGASASFGSLADGETQTKRLDLSTAASSVDISTDTTGSASVDYDMSYTDRTASKNPRIDLDGDGNADASYNGILIDSQSATVDASNIPTGSHTATVMTDGGQVDADIDYTERTATKNPSLDINNDGTADASYSGVLMDGETVTRSVTDISPGSQTAQVSTGHKVGVEAGSTVTTVTQDPSLDIDNDGTAEAEYIGQLADGESQTVQINEFDSGVTEALVGTQSGAVDVNIGYTERTVTEDAGVIINGQPVRMSGTLGQDDTATLSANSSWLQSGQNNVTVVAGDGDTGSDAPAPTVEVDYHHELTTQRAVTFQNEAFSERYNISRTYLSSRESATLTIPHAENIISLRTLEVRLDQSGGWTEVPASARSMQGTELQVDIAALTGGTVPEGTTVELRSVGSKIDVHNGAVTVMQATPVGTDLNSRVRLDSWASDAYISVGNTSQAQQLHYGVNESYSAEGDYAELSTGHEQRVHFPEAVSGSEVGVRAAPVQLSPVNGTIRASVPEQRTNATSPAFTVDPGQRAGESFTVEYLGATEETWYGVYEVDTSQRFDRVQGREPMTVPKDSIDSVVRVKTASAPTANPGGASTIFGAADQGNLVGLVALFGSIAMLFVIGRRPERSREVVDSLATSAGSAAGQLPRVGGLVEDGVVSGIEALGDAIVTLGENTILTSAVGAATLVAAIQSGYIDIGPELGAMLAVAGIALGSLVVLQRAGEFTTARWIAIVGISGVVALQALGEGDLLTALVNSDAFVIVLVIAGYAVIQLVREYRANNSPDDDQPQVNIIARGSGGNGGSDD
ncbi:hypothetical protein G9463_11045 [Haloarcula sp. JP-Z28]|uniref:hypothetical protein n=1 Tax=Haloarcula sp. JP-Z28 TaxID=2716715 RepID=UPI0014055778|nr:hypothetical protein [Haloarcula sp. JP-Z28]NHN63830.1 hypothetical protein [Haloarcula sp. JP-Z28]